MKRTLAVAAAAAIALGTTLAIASPAHASYATCLVPGLDGSVVPGSTFTRDGTNIIQCTGNPYAPTRHYDTCPDGTTAVNGEPVPYDATGEDAWGTPPFWQMTASCV